METQKGAAVFIVMDQKVLLLKRLVDPSKGAWEVPGGKSDPEESVEDTAIREVFEETGLLITLEKKLCIGTFPNVRKPGLFESHIFLASIISGQPYNKEPEKHESLVWFPLDNLPDELGSSTKKGISLFQ